MASVNITTLKTYFNAGDEPTEANFVDVFDSLLSIHADDDTTVAGVTTFSSAPLMTGIQRITVDAATTIDASTSYVDFAVNAASSRVVTMPAATAGRWIRVVWSVEQAGNDRVFTRAGSDDFVGGIFTSVEGNGAGDGDVVSVTDGTVAITAVDDINIGSYLDFHCFVAAQWFVTGHLVVDAVGSVPTIA